MFKFTNKWNNTKNTQGDRIDLGFFADWSDKDVSIRFRIGTCVLFSFGFDWDDDGFETYICLVNFQAGFKTDNKVIKPVDQIIEG